MAVTVSGCLDGETGGIVFDSSDCTEQSEISGCLIRDPEDQYNGMVKVVIDRCIEIAEGAGSFQWFEGSVENTFYACLDTATKKFSVLVPNVSCINYHPSSGSGDRVSGCCWRNPTHITKPGCNGSSYTNFPPYGDDTGDGVGDGDWKVPFRYLIKFEGVKNCWWDEHPGSEPYTPLECCSHGACDPTGEDLNGYWILELGFVFYDYVYDSDNESDPGAFNITLHPWTGGGGNSVTAYNLSGCTLGDGLFVALVTDFGGHCVGNLPDEKCCLVAHDVANELTGCTGNCDLITVCSEGGLASWKPLCYEGDFE